MNERYEKYPVNELTFDGVWRNCNTFLIAIPNLKVLLFAMTAFRLENFIIFGRQCACQLPFLKTTVRYDSHNYGWCRLDIGR